MYDCSSCQVAQVRTVARVHVRSEPFWTLQRFLVRSWLRFIWKLQARSRASHQLLMLGRQDAPYRGLVNVGTFEPLEARLRSGWLCAELCGVGAWRAPHLWELSAAKRRRLAAAAASLRLRAPEQAAQESSHCKAVEFK